MTTPEHGHGENPAKKIAQIGPEKAKAKAPKLTATPSGLRDMSDVRIKHLLEFIDKHCDGERNVLCRKYKFTGSDRSMLYQIIGPKASRPLGEATARRWEVQLSLPVFYFDRIPDDVQESITNAQPKNVLDPERLAALPRTERVILEDFASMLLAKHEPEAQAH